MLSYGRALGEELKGTGVVVTVLCPGPVPSEFAGAAGVTQQQLFAGVPSALIRTPEQVARAGIDRLAAGRRVVIPAWTTR